MLLPVCPDCCRTLSCLLTGVGGVVISPSVFSYLQSAIIQSQARPDPPPPPPSLLAELENCIHLHRLWYILRCSKYQTQHQSSIITGKYTRAPASHLQETHQDEETVLPAPAMIGNLYFELDCFTIALKTMIDDDQISVGCRI